MLGCGQYKAYYENDLTEELKDKIGMFYLKCHDPHVLLPQISVAYTVDGNVYEIDFSLRYWKELLINAQVGYGYMGRIYELEKEGWRKYYSKSLIAYFLIAPEFVSEANRIIGESDAFHVSDALETMFIKKDDYTYYVHE